ncbi:hypothetical protein TpMuguga_02g00447 [Theileria parva strain Muguga]|uniref:uncharacterized protein n=1 Tax=Theileria parva strain Muguga TaxID=333668 RepID=UPI001C616C8C|nr:uncharacterized protein TpMuguga_02g00447 [Theileria parva strain Muguga]EAN32730.2 hypothetical protein TpMuguga_02g00447 [Theileria parva strain Muguga]
MDSVSDYFSFLRLNNNKDATDDKKKTSEPITLKPLRRKLKPDDYMSRVQVEDHIIPIWERETEVSEEKKPVEDITLSYSYSLLSFVSRSITEGTVSSYESDHFELLSESDIEENEVRGVYLHELQHMTNTDIPSSEAYPVYIKGSTINGNTVECIDASPYSQQFPVILYEWFIGIEYNSLDRYSPEAISDGKTFKIPFEAIGKYIFCRAHRLVENQLKGNNIFSNSGPYDPHINVFQNSYPHEKKFHNISTLCSAGPVDISNDLALKILENLSEDYSTDCTLCYNKDFTSGITYEKSNLLNQTVDVKLQLTEKLCIVVSKEDKDKHKIFSIKAFENKVGEDEESEDSVSFEQDLEDILVQDSKHSDTEISFGSYEEKKLKNYFSLKFDDRIQCVTVLYTIRAFMAQQKSGISRDSWTEALDKGDLDFVVKVVREYLSSI